MNITKATEILTALAKPIHQDENPDTMDAIKLGIEALKRVAKMRTYKPTPPGIPLPGETL